MGSRWLVGGLIASVALNLFLIGAGAGVIALGSSMAREYAGVRPGALMAATASLPQPDRHDFRLTLHQIRAAVVADVGRSRALRLDAWSALGDPKSDPVAIKAKLAQSRQIDTGIRATVEEKLVDYVLRLPPADRAAFAAGMRRALTPPPTSAAPRPGATNAAGG
ncbi:MAG TPA: periplasmic heavy metal sensor [Caulobacteraceae bacterium]|nr:periplasmic heavy metal sensor [Caulobacteraceae bacterium]